MKIRIAIIIYFIFVLSCVAITQENPFSQSKFVPDISLIIDGSYFHHNLKNNEYKELILPGITHEHNIEVESHSHKTDLKGFNLNYGELYISSVVDPYFDLTGIFHISQTGLEIEESYFTTRRLPYGLQLKGGKFYSGFGKINEQHPHIWDFVDKPLVFNALFGSEGLNEVGLQLNWVPPLNTFILIGTELLQGTNENSFGSEGFTIQNIEVKSKEQPNLLTSYIMTSLDIKNFTGLIKFSAASGKTILNHGIEKDIGTDAISGNTKIFGISFTSKYLIDQIRNLALQSEYLYRLTKGNKYERDSSGIQFFDLERNQSGFYAQIIYKFSKLWRFGLRYEFFTNNSYKSNGTSEQIPTYLPRYSAMLEFNPTEFSRIRLQYTHDNSKYSYSSNTLTKKTVNLITLQINLSIGAHGYHPF